MNVSKVCKYGMVRTMVGTPYYCRYVFKKSPEVWKAKTYDSKCDLWSLGCV